MTILLLSIPRLSTKSFVNALSDSKYITPASLFLSKNAFTIPKAKNVLPVAASPAIAVILFDGIPPKIEPDSKALRACEPVSIKLSTSPASTPSLTSVAYSLPVSLIISFRKSLIFNHLLIIITNRIIFYIVIITEIFNFVKVLWFKVIRFIFSLFIYRYPHLLNAWLSIQQVYLILV